MVASGTPLPKAGTNVFHSAEMCLVRVQQLVKPSPECVIGRSTPKALQLLVWLHVYVADERNASK